MRIKQVINITLSDDLLKAVDKQAEVELRNRSELVREADRTYILNKNANEIHKTFTNNESNRVKDIINFSDFRDSTTLALSCSFRPQPNKIENIFAGNGSELIKYIENPKSFRNMGWDLRTLGRAVPVAGEYLQITNGDRKIIRIYRDGQIIFAASEDFFGHGMEIEQEEVDKTFKFNSMASAEVISNFTNFTLEIAKYFSINPTGLVYKVRIFNPKRKHLELISLGTFPDKLGELTLDYADREVFILIERSSSEKIAYSIWAELNYLFGVSEDHFSFVNKTEKLMNFEEFVKKQ